MTKSIRDTVVTALHQATGLLNDPDLAREVLAGRNIAFSRIEMDSLSLFEVIMEIEEELDLALDADEISDLPDLNALIAFLGSRVSVANVA